MNKTTKATLWILGVFAALSLAAYFAACGDDTAADTGTPPPAGCTAAGGTCKTEAGDAGKCYAATGGKFVCYADCTTPGDACTGGTCYYDGSGTSGTFACAPTGTKAVAEACGAWDECVAGVQCLELEGSMSCFQICTDTCDAGDCTDTGFGFKVCVAAATT